MRKFIIPILLCIICMTAFSLPVRADEESDGEESVYDYGALFDKLPSEVRALLPDGIEDSGDAQTLTEFFDAEYLTSLCTDLLIEGATAGLKIFSKMLGLIILSAILSRCADLVSNSKTQVFDHVILIIASLEIYGILYSLFELTQSYLSNLNDYMTAISASLTSIFLLSANVSLAATQAVWLGILLTFCEKISYGVLLPLLQMSFALTIASSISPEFNLRSVTSFIRQLCTTLLIASMTVITVIMAFQTNIAAASDSVGLRSIKFAASNSVPLIGGLVSESMKTLATSLSLVKSVAGMVGVVGLLLCALLPLSILFTCRSALSLSSTAADLLQSEGIKPLIDETVKLIGFLIAILLTFSIFYLFTLSVLIHTANALV